MIGPHDRVRLPAGVELRDGALFDVVRLRSVPVNATGAAALAAATPRDAATLLARRYGVDPDTALQDVLGFCAELNARLLLEIVPRRGRAVLAWRWLHRVPFLLPLGLVPTLPTVRRGVDTASAQAIVSTGVRALAGFLVLLLVATTFASIVLLGAFGVAAPTLVLALGIAVVATVALHELAHLLALRGVPACVATRGLRVAIVHRAVSRHRTRAVASAGPTAGLALGGCLLAAVHTFPSSEVAAGALVALLNALGLTVASRDGRTLCGLP